MSLKFLQEGGLFIMGLSSGSGSSMFVKTNGTLWGMGNNDRGQLGGRQHDQPNQSCSGIGSIQCRSSFFGSQLYCVRQNGRYALGNGNIITKVSWEMPARPSEPVPFKSLGYPTSLKFPQVLSIPCS